MNASPQTPLNFAEITSLSGQLLTRGERLSPVEKQQLAQMGKNCAKKLVELCVAHHEQVGNVLQLLQNLEAEQIEEILTIAAETENRISRVVADFEAQEICNEIHSKQKETISHEAYTACPIETDLMKRLMQTMISMSVFSAADFNQAKKCPSLISLEHLIENKIKKLKQQKRSHVTAFWKNKSNWSLLPQLKAATSQ